MAVVFSAREVVEAAVEKEKKRKQFYAKVSQLSRDPEMKELFQFLKEEEKRHVEAFTRILGTLSTENRPVEYDEDMEAYMDSVIDERLYSRMDSEEFVEEAIEKQNVFRLAIGFEKDAILYFREFLPYLNESDRGIVEDLIEQEKGHIRKLAELKGRGDNSHENK